MPKRGLGRGLEALLPGNEEVAGETAEIAIREIKPNQYQPRRVIDEEKLAELVESIREHGVVQPILVRPTAGGYELVAGERRWRAAQLVGLDTIPAVVKDYDDAQSMEIALVENLQREDLNPVEEADAFRRLMEEFKLTQEDVARRVGRSRPAVANALRLLSLPEGIREDVSRGTISAGHARAILSLDRDDLKARLTEAIKARHLSVRQAEELAKELPKHKAAKGRPTTAMEPALKEVEENLRRAFGTQVHVKQTRGKVKGRIEVEYYSREDLERILDLVLGRRAGPDNRAAASRDFPT
ncbi:MAG: ParB/RepB/Spo0J family partition protein [Bacillota bacterium]